MNCILCTTKFISVCNITNNIFNFYILYKIIQFKVHITFMNLYQIINYKKVIIDEQLRI